MCRLHRSYRQNVVPISNEWCAALILDSQKHLCAVVKKGKASSLDIAPLTILDSGALQPRKWQLTGNDCSTAAQAVAAQSPR